MRIEYDSVYKNLILVQSALSLRTVIKDAHSYQRIEMKAIHKE